MSEVCPDTPVLLQGHTEEELVRQLRQQLVQDADKLRGSALCDVLWSLGILDDLPVATYTQLASLLEQQPLRDFQPSVCLQTPDAINCTVRTISTPALHRETFAQYDSAKEGHPEYFAEPNRTCQLSM